MKKLNKRTLTIFLAFFLPALFSFSSAVPGEEIVGIWLTANGGAKIQIYRNQDQYFGKIIAGKDLFEANGALKKDAQNDDHAKRGRTIKDLVLLSGFKYDDGIWTGGTIYDPKNGSTYKCKMKLNGSSLEIRGYIGVSLFGRTEIGKEPGIKSKQHYS